MANALFVDLLSEYRTRYPEVQLDVDLSGRMVHLVDEGFDLALRMTPTPNEGLIARPIAKIRFHRVAAPAYLERYGRPTRLDQLDGHQLLIYTLTSLGTSASIPGPNGVQTIQFVPALQSTNETLLHLAALNGMGIAMLPKFLVTEDLASGRLELVLPAHATFEATLHGVYPSRKYLSAKVRTFLDFIAADSRFSS